MTDVFSLIPKVRYNGHQLSNILTRVIPRAKWMENYTVYFPYHVKEGERPDTIAYDYYGSSDYAWLVLLANQIHDPYFQWPLSYNQFNQMLLDRYPSIESIKQQVHHYEYQGIDTDTAEEVQRISFQTSADTYDSWTNEQRFGWVPVYVYDYEKQINEDRQSITLLSKHYIPQIDREIVELYAGQVFRG